jgi:hypothetical protein
MRAVSLASGVVGGVPGAGAAAGNGAAGGAGAAAVVPMGRGTGVLAAGGGGGTAADGGGGGNVRGAGTLTTGGLGNGTCDTGGRGIGTLPGFGTSGFDVGGGSDIGGRAGRLIRTVSSSCGAASSPRRGGRLIRVVSFFGSLASDMVTSTGGKISLSEISGFVTRQLTLEPEKANPLRVIVVAAAVTGGRCLLVLPRKRSGQLHSHLCSPKPADRSLDCHEFGA